eukprot:2890941-Rhodomonas_salina.2
MRQHDQRVYGIYDNHAVHEMRADAYGAINPTSITEDVLNMPIPKDPVSNLVPNDANPLYNLESGNTPNETLDLLPESDAEYDEAEATSQLSTQPSEPVAGTLTLRDSRANGGVVQSSGGCAEARGGVIQNSRGPTLTRGGTVGIGGGPDHDGAASAGEFRPAKRQRFSEAPPPYCQLAKHWWDCEEERIDQVSDTELAEFPIGHSINMAFPRDFWPGEGQWTGEAFDTTVDHKHFGQQQCLKVLLTSGPKSRKFGEHTVIPITHNPPRNKTNVSIRRAIAEHFPHAVLCKDLTI